MKPVKARVSVLEGNDLVSLSVQSVGMLITGSFARAILAGVFNLPTFPDYSTLTDLDLNLSAILYFITLYIMHVLHRNLHIIFNNFISKVNLTEIF